ncbi:MAG: coproporphyrinogen dehydrogenase HemZ [Oscillospiraceae bacterium]|nr:coproporphyrinogen dehydrogenase HemZ [Oscillospiraceae bacterium]
MINKEILTGAFKGEMDSQWGVLTGVRPVKLITKLTDRGLSDGEAIKSFMEELGVSEMRSRICLAASEFSRTVRDGLAARDILLYIGIPFCPTRCTYCSFVSNSMPGAMKLLDPFMDMLLYEMEYAAERLKISGLNIRAVYIGGGTPTTLDEERLERLLSAVERHFGSGFDEYTVEAGRPDTVTDKKLETMLRHGVNRISINPQSLSPAVLSAIGRQHGPEEFFHAFEAARRAGFRYINCDLIAGLPADNPESFKDTLRRVMELSPENITVHTLAVKRGSTINELGAALPTADEVRAMLDHGAETLTGAGYRPYYLYRQKNSAGGFENTGWTKPAMHSLYNVATMEELCGNLALGGGAVSKMMDPVTGFITRAFNPKYPYEYNTNREKIEKCKDEFFDFYRERSLPGIDVPNRE